LAPATRRVQRSCPRASPIIGVPGGPSSKVFTTWRHRAGGCRERRAAGARMPHRHSPLLRAPLQSEKGPRAHASTFAHGAPGMEITVEQGSVVEVATPLLVVNLFEDTDTLGGATAAVDAALGGLLGRLRESGELRGKSGEIVLVHNSSSGLRAERVA